MRSIKDRIRDHFQGVPSLEQFGEEIILALDGTVVSEALNEMEVHQQVKLEQALIDLQHLLVFMGDVGIGIRTVSEVWEEARRIAERNDFEIRGLR